MAAEGGGLLVKSTDDDAHLVQQPGAGFSSACRFFPAFLVNPNLEPYRGALGMFYIQ